MPAIQKLHDLTDNRGISYFFLAFKIKTRYIFTYIKCTLYSRQASNKKIVILGVYLNKTCYKTGRVRTHDFTVVEFGLAKYFKMEFFIFA